MYREKLKRITIAHKEYKAYPAEYCSKLLRREEKSRDEKVFILNTTMNISNMLIIGNSSITMMYNKFVTIIDSLNINASMSGMVLHIKRAIESLRDSMFKRSSSRGQLY